MIDLNLDLDIHNSLREGFGRPRDWPTGVGIAQRLLMCIAWHLGQADTARLLLCAEMANDTFQRSQNPRREYATYLARATEIAVFSGPSEKLDQIWPTVLAMHQTLGQERWEAFVSTALTAFEEAPAVAGV